MREMRIAYSILAGKLKEKCHLIHVRVHGIIIAGIEPPTSVKGQKYLDQLSDFNFFKKNPPAWSQFSF
jgi:hypothetical protein